MTMTTTAPALGGPAIPRIVPRSVTTITLWSAFSATGAMPVRTFAYLIFISLFISSKRLHHHHGVNDRRMGRWRDDLVGKKTYMLFSPVAKMLLGRQVFAGALRP